MKCVFIVLDTVRRDYLESYGNSWVQTPNLLRLSQSGVTYDNHWVGSLPCMPARREFMTGRYNFIYRGWGPIEPFDDVLPTELRRAGIFSHLLTDHQHYFELGGENYHTAFNTWDFFRGQEGDAWMSLVDSVAIPAHLGQYAQQNFKNRSRQLVEEDFSGPRTATAAIEWLKANRDADNWLLQVEIFDPHEPFYCTQKYRDMYDDKWDGPHFDWPGYQEVSESPDAVEHIRKCYAGLLTMTDVWVGKILDTLEELALFDETLIIFTTDHGTLLAEHNYWMKLVMPLYSEIARIPLAIKQPGNVHAGRRVDALTQSIDVMPTILRAFDVPSPPHVHGHPILPDDLVHSHRADALFGYFGKATNITDGEYVYMRNPVNSDGGPLHAYTAMPTGIPITGLYFPREVYDRIEMGRYFGHTYNMPLFKIPIDQSDPPRPLDGEEPYVGRHQLFNISTDPNQLSPIDDPGLENHFSQRIIAHLHSCEAPFEQFTRLGLQA